MNNITDTGIIVDDTVTYCNVSDVQRYIRSFTFDANSNPTDTEVDKFIESRTRFIEKNIRTSFRTLKLENKEIDVHFNEEQNRHTLNRRSMSRNNSYPSVSSYPNDKTTKVNLPHYIIGNISKLELITQAGVNDITSETDNYRLNERDGILYINQRQFKPTQTDNFADKRYISPRIKITYTYGFDSIEPDVRDACAKLVTYDIINSDEFGEVRADVENLVSTEEYTSRIKEEAMDTLENYK